MCKCDCQRSKSILGFRSMSIFCFTDHLSAIKQLLYAQGSFIYWFMNSLAANTSLLRSNVQSKSSKSVVSLQVRCRVFS